MGKWSMQPNLNEVEKTLGSQMIYQYWENAEIFGYPIKYLKPLEIENNNIFGESTARKFIQENGFDFKVQKDEDSIFNGSEMFGGFGYSPSYTNIFYIPVKYFEDEDIEPEEGDVIYESIEDIFYEVTKVDTKNETQTNLKMNGTVFSRKIYLKQYQFSYKDSFDDDLNLKDDSFDIDDEFDLTELDKLNETLDTNIDETNVLDKEQMDDVFGELR